MRGFSFSGSGAPLRVLAATSGLVVVAACAGAGEPGPSRTIGTVQGALQDDDGPDKVAQADAALSATADKNGQLGLLVHLQAGSDRGPLKGFLKGHGAAIKYEYQLLPNTVAVRGLPQGAIHGLRSVPGVAGLEPEKAYSANLQQSLPLMKADATALQAAGVTATGAGRVVCVIDTGIAKTHGCFPAGKIVAETDFVNDDGDASDDNGHGTHVSGIVACEAAPNVGVAPGAKLAAAKVLNASGNGTTSDILAAIDWCTLTAGADVINLSLGAGKAMGDCDGDSEAVALDAAAAQGVVPVVASGNENYSNGVGFPACAARALAVGAVYDANVGGKTWSVCKDTSTAADKIVCFSNESPTVDVSAPGSVITSAAMAGGWTDKSGTSMAAPHVAGLAALIQEAIPLASVDDVRDRLWASSDDKGAVGFDDAHGHGRVNAVRAITEAAPLACLLPEDCGTGSACSVPACQNGWCVFSSPCNDGDACTTDTCNAGSCATAAINPADSLSCTADACDPCLGVTHTPTTNTCGDTCLGAVRIRVGQTVSGNTKGVGKNFTTTCASGYTQRGPELVYRLTLRAKDHVRITVTPGTAWDPSLYILAPTGTGDCNLSRCFAGVDKAGTGAETLRGFTAPADGDYLVVVDTYYTSGGGPFTLAVTPVCYADETGRPCDDFNGCTANDTCQPDGTCAGT